MLSHFGPGEACNHSPRHRHLTPAVLFSPVTLYSKAVSPVKNVYGENRINPLTRVAVVQADCERKDGRGSR